LTSDTKSRRRGRPRLAIPNVFGTGLTDAKRVRLRRRAGKLEREKALAVQFEVLASVFPDLSKEALYRLLSEMSVDPEAPRRSPEATKAMLMRLKKANRRISRTADTSQRAGADASMSHAHSATLSKLRDDRKRRSTSSS
jgi:hypothetical protein